MPFNRSKYFSKRGKKSERLANAIFQSPDAKSINKVRYIFGEKQI